MELTLFFGTVKNVKAPFFPTTNKLISDQKFCFFCTSMKPFPEFLGILSHSFLFLSLPVCLEGPRRRGFPSCASPNRAVPKMTFQVQRLLPFICNKCSLLRSFFFCCSQQHSQKGNTLCRTWKTGRLCLCSLHGGSLVHRGNTEMLQPPRHHPSPCWALPGSSLPALTWRAQNWTQGQDRVEGQGHLPPAAGHSS